MKADEARRIANEKININNTGLILGWIEHAAQEGRYYIDVDGSNMNTVTRAKLESLGYSVLGETTLTNKSRYRVSW